ncbi:unnamed protein product [Discula destructiva]
MLPPVEDSVLQNNPDFAALYGTLTTAILNPDGTTKDDHSRAAKEREGVRKELDAHRLTAAKQHLLAQAIAAAVPPEPSTSASAKRAKQDISPAALPDELVDLMLLLPPLLTSAEELPPETLSLLLSSPPFSSLDVLVPDLASLVSSNLQASAVQLARAANPTANASFLHRHIPTLPVQISTLSSTASQRATALVDARLATANSLVELLKQHCQALSLIIRALEAKHGGVARSLELRGADVALEAQRGAIDAESALWMARRDLYSPEVREALQNYADHVKDGQRRLKEAVRMAKMELGEYGVEPEDDGTSGDVIKERRLREVARAYRDVRRQIDEAQRDLERLR